MENIFTILACSFYCKIWTNIKMISINYKIIYNMFYVKKLDKTFKKKKYYSSPSIWWPANRQVIATNLGNLYLKKFHITYIFISGENI